MGKSKNKRATIIKLIIALVAIIAFSVLFIGAVAGWFDSKKATIDAEYQCTEQCDYVNLTATEYKALIDDQKSFILLVDQGGCTTADRMREFVANYSNEAGFKVAKIMFSDMKETSLHNYVKYYPSVVIISHGQPIAWLRADSDEDSEAYNDYDTFKNWIKQWI
ncbi:hypothetical protein IKF67_02610 [Candidatus Saccharibacteria bacterium]|nr:hypothetical protein [Candidatus Saccharibacteria bacterium]